jgi:hypothetical protein
LLVQPAPAFLLGHYAFGLSEQDLLAVTVLAALPTAQNVAVYALTYDHSVVLARDAVTTSTVAAVPVIGASWCSSTDDPNPRRPQSDRRVHGAPQPSGSTRGSLYGRPRPARA